MTGTAIAIAAPRLPFHPAIEQRFGIDVGAWRVLTDAVFPAAAQPESIIMALAYCRARNLDIFKKPVQIVPIWDRKRGAMVDTVWPGISELRTTAMRTGSFAGFDDTAYGPLVEEKLGGIDVRYPEWAQCTVYRLVGGQRVPFVGPKVFWIETYATAKRDTKAPNSMWLKRPRGQIEKCAEAAALRRAFPEEIGGEYAAEEMEGQGVYSPDATRTPGLADRLEAARVEGDLAVEGFTALHQTVEAEHVDQSAAAPADDAFVDQTSDDEFPGDRPSAREGEGAAPAEAKSSDDAGAASDLDLWADDLIGRLPFMTPAEVEALEQDRPALAKFAALRVQNLDKARELEAAINTAKGRAVA